MERKHWLPGIGFSCIAGRRQIYVRLSETSLAVSSIGRADICIHIVHILPVLTIINLKYSELSDSES